jgi:hypothetical protein
MVDAVAQSLANATISHFNSQLEAVDKPSHRQSTMFQACSPQPCAGLSGAGGSGHVEAEGVFGFGPPSGRLRQQPKLGPPLPSRAK